MFFQFLVICGPFFYILFWKNLNYRFCYCAFGHKIIIFFFLKFKREEGITEFGFGDLQILNDGN